MPVLLSIKIETTVLGKTVLYAQDCGIWINRPLLNTVFVGNAIFFQFPLKPPALNLR